MAEMSNYLENALINVTLRATSYTAPTTVYLALYTTDPTDADTGTECSGTSYARQAVTFGAPSNGASVTTADITFDQATSSWGTITHIGIWDSSSTGNMLVDDLDILEKIFSQTNLLIAVHCEDESTIKENLKLFKDKYGEDIPMNSHPLIRSREACYISSSNAIKLAKKTGARLHVFHLSTAEETKLFSNKEKLKDKKIDLGIRPEHLIECKEKDAIISGKLDLVENLGEYALVHMTSDNGMEFIAKLNNSPTEKKGEKLYFKANKDFVHYFDSSNGVSI